MRKLILCLGILLYSVAVHSQNVGIGTTIPPAKLSVVGSYSDPSIPGSTSTGIFRVGINTNEGIDFGKMGSGAFAGWIQAGFNGTFSDPLSLQPMGGNVGIGTTGPSDHLHIYGNNSQSIMLESPSGGATVNLLKVRTYSGMAANTYVGFGGTDDGLSSSRASIYVPNAANTGVMEAFSVLKSSGNVGIGTTNPGATLEVAGTLKITGGTPSAGKVLTSDATGLASWTTLSTPTVPDALPTIQIGTQKWMSKNLDVAFYRNGDPIPQVTDPTAWAGLTTGAWCYYNNDSTQGTTYGKLYNWYAVNDTRGLAPTGWHIPSDAEWSALSTTLGGDAVSGGKMKEAGTPHWTSPNTAGNNNSGFAGLPGGGRFGGGAFFDVGYFGYWWSSTELTTSYAWYRNLYYLYGGIGRTNHGKQDGFSVRCLRD